MELRSILIGAVVAIAFIYLIATEPAKVSLLYRGIYAAIALTAILTIGYGIMDRYGSDQVPR